MQQQLLQQQPSVKQVSSRCSVTACPSMQHSTLISAVQPCRDSATAAARYSQYRDSGREQPLKDDSLQAAYSHTEHIAIWNTRTSRTLEMLKAGPNMNRVTNQHGSGSHCNIHVFQSIEQLPAKQAGVPLLCPCDIDVRCQLWLPMNSLTHNPPIGPTHNHHAHKIPSSAQRCCHHLVTV